MPGGDAWVHLGTGIRYKTYSWHLADGRAYGGAAGWLADGTPFWFGAMGSSRSALSSWSLQLASMLPGPRLLPGLNLSKAANGPRDNSCVDVDFFARYPIRAVWRDATTARETRRAAWPLASVLRPVAPVNRRNLTWNRPVRYSQARSHRNRYPRVADREAQVAVAARGGTGDRGAPAHPERASAGCWRIADSAAPAREPQSAQRRRARRAGSAATSAAGVAGSHSDAAGPNRLAWKDAVARAKEGWSFERILVQAYPRASFSTLSGREDCTRLEAAERWLASASAGWSGSLRREPGFEAPDETPRVCALRDGHPYSDQQRLRIYARGWRSLDERVTLAHEYLHLAFRFHPNGADEGYIERLARRMAGS